jgi:hypothetical protein
MWRGGVGNTVEGRRERQKIWSKSTLGFGGLQPLEIAQNRQSFVWKTLEKNTLDLEKLGEMQGGPPLFRRLRCVSSATAEIVGHETTRPWLRTHRRFISWRAGLLRLRLAMTDGGTDTPRTV